MVQVDGENQQLIDSTMADETFIQVTKGGRSKPTPKKVVIDEGQNKIHPVAMPNTNLEEVGIMFRAKARNGAMPKVKQVLKKLLECMNTHGNEATIWSWKKTGVSAEDVFTMHDHLITEYFSAYFIGNRHGFYYMKILVATKQTVEHMKTYLIRMFKEVKEMDLFINLDNFWTGQIVDAGGIVGIHPTHANRSEVLVKIQNAISDHVPSTNDMCDRHTEIWNDVESQLGKGKIGAPPLQILIRTNIVNMGEKGDDKVESGKILTVLCDRIVLEVVRDILEEIFQINRELIPGAVFISHQMAFSPLDEERQQHRALLAQHREYIRTARAIIINHMSHQTLEFENNVQVEDEVSERKVQSIRQTILSPEVNLFTSIETTPSATITYLMTTEKNYETATMWCVDNLKTLCTPASAVNLKSFGGKYPIPVLPLDITQAVRNTRLRKTMIKTAPPPVQRRKAWAQVNWTPAQEKSHQSGEEMSQVTNADELRSTKAENASLKSQLEEAESAKGEVMSQLTETRSMFTDVQSQLKEVQDEFRETVVALRTQHTEQITTQSQSMALLVQQMSEQMMGEREDREERRRQERQEHDERREETRRSQELFFMTMQQRAQEWHVPPEQPWARLSPGWEKQHEGSVATQDPKSLVFSTPPRLHKRAEPQESGEKRELAITPSRATGQYKKGRRRPQDESSVSDPEESDEDDDMSESESSKSEYPQEEEDNLEYHTGVIAVDDEASAVAADEVTKQNEQPPTETEAKGDKAKQAGDAAHNAEADKEVPTLNDQPPPKGNEEETADEEPKMPDPTPPGIAAHDDTETELAGQVSTILGEPPSSSSSVSSYKTNDSDFESKSESARSPHDALSTSLPASPSTAHGDI
jgi:hypothetical protein